MMYLTLHKIDEDFALIRIRLFIQSMSLPYALHTDTENLHCVAYTLIQSIYTDFYTLKLLKIKYK